MARVAAPEPLTGGRPPFTADESRRLDRALCRGASPSELVDLLMDSRGLRPRRVESAEESQLRHDMELELYQLVYPRYLAFRRRVAEEYDALGPHVRAAIRGIALMPLTPQQRPDDWLRLVRENVQDALRDLIPEMERRAGAGVEAEMEAEYYMRIRADYCAAGYEDPRQLFDRIDSPKSVSFLGLPVQHGVHHMFATELRKLERTLPDAVARTIRKQLARERVGSKGKIVDDPGVILGFQPRRIAGSTQLSNHAFGLAIDINPTINPHIRDKSVIKALKEITAGMPDAPDGYDFGAALVPPKPGGDVDLVALHTRAKAASDRVRDWLDEAGMEEARSRMRIRLNEEAVVEAKRKLKEAKDRGAPPAEQDALKEAVATAAADLAQAKSDDAKNPVLVRLRLLRKVHGDEVTEWAEHGIVNIPLELLEALKSVPCMRWGGEYEGSKDSMHFELMADVDRRTGEARCRQGDEP